jgi:dolichol-phosphate mannosyltransferase
MALTEKIKSYTELAPDLIKISIVVPAYNEADNIDKLYEKLLQTLETHNLSWELIFVDDGSTDETWLRISQLHSQDQRVMGIRFSRNFGHQYALFAGLAQISGQAVITMDADLQHPPEVIPSLITEWQEGNKIVNTVRLDSESTPWLKRVSAKIFYKLFSRLAGVQLENGMADFRLLDRQIVETLLQFQEGDLFLRGIVNWIGYPKSAVQFRAQDRFSGASKYTLKKMFKLAHTGITSFSLMPLRIALGVGTMTILAALVQASYLLYLKLFTGAALSQWISALSIITFLFGTLFILLGIVGDYIGRILLEARGRPRFLISEQVGFNDAHQAATSLPIQSLVKETLVGTVQFTPLSPSLRSGQHLHQSVKKV